MIAPWPCVALPPSPTLPHHGPQAVANIDESELSQAERERNILGQDIFYRPKAGTAPAVVEAAELADESEFEPETPADPLTKVGFRF